MSPAAAPGLVRPGAVRHVRVGAADGDAVVLTLIGLLALAGAAWRVLRWHVRRSLLTTRPPVTTASPFGVTTQAAAFGAGAAPGGATTSSPGVATTSAPGVATTSHPGHAGWDVPFFAPGPAPGSPSPRSPSPGGPGSPTPVAGSLPTHPHPAHPQPPGVGGPAPSGGLPPLVPSPRRAPAALRPFPKVSVGLCLVVALVCGTLVGQHTWLQHRLTMVATALAGSRATVHCQTFGETWTDLGAELGFVKYGSDGVPEHHTVIKWDPCRALKSWMGSDHHSWTTDELIAVHVLTHEAMHMRGETVEARAECQAMQRDAVTARLLGASAEDAHRLARAYWLTIYPRMSGDYTAPQCSRDGPWDEHLPDAPWG